MDIVDQGRAVLDELYLRIGTERDMGRENHSTARIMMNAADEIERLRAHVEALQQKIDADKSCACAYDAPGGVCLPHSPVVAELRSNLTEALRLMEPVADLVGGAVNGNWTYLVPYDDARAISAFVTRMKGE